MKEGLSVIQAKLKVKSPVYHLTSYILNRYYRFLYESTYQGVCRDFVNNRKEQNPATCGNDNVRIGEPNYLLLRSYPPHANQINPNHPPLPLHHFNPKTSKGNPIFVLGTSSERAQKKKNTPSEEKTFNRRDTKHNSIVL